MNIDLFSYTLHSGIRKQKLDNEVLSKYGAIRLHSSFNILPDLYNEFGLTVIHILHTKRIIFVLSYNSALSVYKNYIPTYLHTYIHVYKYTYINLTAAVRKHYMNYGFLFDHSFIEYVYTLVGMNFWCYILITTLSRISAELSICPRHYCIGKQWVRICVLKTWIYRYLYGIILYIYWLRWCENCRKRSESKRASIWKHAMRIKYDKQIHMRVVAICVRYGNTSLKFTRCSKNVQINVALFMRSNLR